MLSDQHAQETKEEICFLLQSGLIDRKQQEILTQNSSYLRGNDPENKMETDLSISFLSSLPLFPLAESIRVICVFVFMCKYDPWENQANSDLFTIMYSAAYKECVHFYQLLRAMNKKNVYNDQHPLYQHINYLRKDIS